MNLFYITSSNGKLAVDAEGWVDLVYVWRSPFRMYVSAEWQMA